MPWPSISLLDARQLDGAVALFSAQLQEHGITTPADALRSVAQSVVADPRYGFIVLASTVEAGPVGVAYASCLLSLEHGGISGWLEELYVLPEWRGRGIGSRLVAEVIARAKDLGWVQSIWKWMLATSALFHFICAISSNSIHEPAFSGQSVAL